MFGRNNGLGKNCYQAQAASCGVGDPVSLLPVKSCYRTGWLGFYSETGHCGACVVVHNFNSSTVEAEAEVEAEADSLCCFESSLIYTGRSRPAGLHGETLFQKGKKSKGTTSTLASQWQLRK